MKKGEEKLSNKLIFYSIVFVLVAVIIFSMFRFVSNALDDTTFWRYYYSRDIGLIASMGQSGRGTLDMQYEMVNAEKPLAFDIYPNNTIQTFEWINSEKNLPTSFVFFGSGETKLVQNRVASKYFNIFITPDKAEFTSENLRKDSCLFLDTKQDLKNVKMYFDSSLNSPDLENFVKTVKQGLLKPKMASSKYEQGIDLTIIFIKGAEDSINFFYDHNLRRNERLSCMIKNKLLEKFPDKFFASRLTKIPDNSIWKRTLENSDIGLVIALKDYSFESAVPIVAGVNEYYG